MRTTQELGSPIAELATIGGIHIPANGYSASVAIVIPSTLYPIPKNKLIRNLGNVVIETET